MQGVETDYTIKNLVYMYKGQSVCKNEASDFKLCRATPAGKYGDATLCEPKAASFLLCYHDMVTKSKADCAS